jgi:hypothetical protein
MMCTTIFNCAFKLQANTLSDFCNAPLLNNRYIYIKVIVNSLIKNPFLAQLFKFKLPCPLQLSHLN